MRGLTIALTLGALLVVTSCGYEVADTDEPPLTTAADLGTGYVYAQDTLDHFLKLVNTERLGYLNGGGWKLADPARNPQGMLEAVHVGTRLTFVLIPAGSFLMGSPEEEEGRDDDEELHSVTIRRAFLLCKTECSESAWCKEEVYGAPRDKYAHRPVHESCMMCRDWCARIGLRLPYESEWEYACRAGTQTRFSFGDDDADLPKYEWYFVNSGVLLLPTNTEFVPELVPDLGCEMQAVGQKPPNPWGLHDMHGNVSEWCEDGYHRVYASAPTDRSARAMPDYEFRVFRGGSWSDSAQACRSASRDGAFIDVRGRSRYVGFRPAADLPEQEQDD
jgi:formylglycine-generating enzyme required for sulfatase activity